MNQVEVHHRIGIVLVFIIALNLAFFCFRYIYRARTSQLILWMTMTRAIHAFTDGSEIVFHLLARFQLVDSDIARQNNKQKQKSTIINWCEDDDYKRTFIFCISRAPLEWKAAERRTFISLSRVFWSLGSNSMRASAQDDGAGQRRRFTLWPAQQQHTSLSPYVSGICTKVWEECAHYSEDSGLIWVALFS